MLPEVWAGLRDGARAALSDPLPLLATLAVAWLARGAAGAAGAAGARPWAPLASFLLAAAVTRWLPPHPAHPGIACGLLGALALLMVAGVRPTGRARLLAAAAGGGAFGLAAGLPLALLAEAAGSLLVGGLALGLLLIVAAQAERRTRGHLTFGLAGRVLGAWIAAIALLMMALQLWGRRG